MKTGKTDTPMTIDKRWRNKTAKHRADLNERAKQARARKGEKQLGTAHQDGTEVRNGKVFTRTIIPPSDR